VSRRGALPLASIRAIAGSTSSVHENPQRAPHCEGCLLERFRDRSGRQDVFQQGALFPQAGAWAHRVSLFPSILLVQGFHGRAAADFAASQAMFQSLLTNAPVLPSALGAVQSVGRAASAAVLPQAAPAGQAIVGEPDPKDATKRLISALWNRGQSLKAAKRFQAARATLVALGHRLPEAHPLRKDCVAEAEALNALLDAEEAEREARLRHEALTRGIGSRAPSIADIRRRAKALGGSPSASPADCDDEVDADADDAASLRLTGDQATELRRISLLLPPSQGLTAPAGVAPSSASVERREIAQLMKQYSSRGLQAGQALYLIQGGWWRQWCGWSGYGSTVDGNDATDESKTLSESVSALSQVTLSTVEPLGVPSASPSDRPGAIDNSGLIEATLAIDGEGDGAVASTLASGAPPSDGTPLFVVLKRGLRVGGVFLPPWSHAAQPPQEGTPAFDSFELDAGGSGDAVLVGEQVWKRLVGEFGGGPCVPRLVSDARGNDEDCDTVPAWQFLAVELFPEADVRARLTARIDEAARSLAGPAGQAEDSRPPVRGILSAGCAPFLPGTTVPLGPRRIQQAEATLPPPALLPYPSSVMPLVPEACTAFTERADVFASRGVVGLRNLGNTCFLNSAVQCLSACWPLASWALRGFELQELNESNALGTGGVLGREWGHLLRMLWSHERVAKEGGIAPEGLKDAVGRFRREFQGFRQHDAHEFMTFLLDGIHEDSNRVLHKPYGSCPEDVPGGVLAHARASWRWYQQRNRSHTAHVMFGLLQSRLDCPSCGHVSVKYEPFNSLQLPIPASNTFEIRVTVNLNDPTARSPASYTCDKHEGIGASTPDDKLGGDDSGLRLAFPTTRELVMVGRHGATVGSAKHDAASRLLSCEPDLFPGESVESLARRFVAFRYDRGGIAEVFTDESVLRSFRAMGEPRPLAFLDLSLMDPPSSAEALVIPPSIVPPPTHEEMGAVLAVEVQLLLPASARWTREAGLRQLVPRGRPFVVSIPSLASCLELRQRIATVVCHAFSSAAYSGDPLATRCSDANVALAAKSLPLYWHSEGSAEPVAVPTSDSPVLACVDRSLIRPEKYPSMWIGTSLAIIESWHHALDTRSLYVAPVPTAHATLNDEAVESCRGSTTLHACLSEFAKPERLGKDNEWFCAACKRHVQATKQMRVVALPDVLCLQLSRFTSHGVLFKSKLRTDVEFPLTSLDVAPVLLPGFHRMAAEEQSLADRLEVPPGAGYGDAGHKELVHAAAAATAKGGDGILRGSDGEAEAPPPVDKPSPPGALFDLFGVVRHHGGMLGGHYTADTNRYVARYGAMAEGGGGGGVLSSDPFGSSPCESVLGDPTLASSSWSHFDDHIVTPCRAEHVSAPGDAYLLFYRRRGAVCP
jgi:ubiquitin C-terminal hydrolase